MIDDDEAIRVALVDVLEIEGYHVLTATHGRQALEHLGNGDRPCLILLDLMMPEMDGPSFLSALRADLALSGIPVVVISAYKDIADSLKGISGVLKKPFDLSELLEQVRRHCGDSSLPSA